MNLFIMPITLCALAILWRLGWPSVNPGKIRRQLDRFARRERLVVTPANGGLLVRALAISRRWRRFGLVCGLLIGIGIALPQSISVNASIMFLGWFVGAVIAEWRIAALPVTGTRRAAGLERRSVASYVTPGNRILTAVFLLGLAASTVYGVFVDPILAGRSARWPFLIVVAAAAAALRLTFQRVTGRPQPFVDGDARQADDALRGHSLTVLTGCVIATIGWLCNRILDGTALAAIGFPILVGAAITGWWVASWSTSARARFLQMHPAGGEGELS